MKPSASTTSDARFSLRRVQAVTRKEIWHIWRDPFTLGMALVLPMILVVIFGIAIDFDVHNAPLAVQDQSQSAASREFIRIFANSGTFRIEPTHTDGSLEGQFWRYRHSSRATWRLRRRSMRSSCSTVPTTPRPARS
jgi:hypothetical protein